MPALTAETTDYQLDIDTGQRCHWIVGRDSSCELLLEDKGISRFHATIFALSQNCLPVGVDYRIGQKYKVTAVMEDAGQADFCCRIDTVDPDWIAARLRDRVNARRGARP